MRKTKKQKASEQFEEVIVGSFELLPKIHKGMTAEDIKKLIEDDYRERIQKKLQEKFPGDKSLTQSETPKKRGYKSDNGS